MERKTFECFLHEQQSLRQICHRSRLSREQIWDYTGAGGDRGRVLSEQGKQYKEEPENQCQSNSGSEYCIMS